MGDYNYGNPPPYSTNPPPSSAQAYYSPPGPGGGYATDYPNAYSAPPPQAAATAPPITPQPSVQRNAAVPQAQPNRSRVQKKKKQQQQQQQLLQQQQARPKMTRQSSAPSQISLCTKYSLFFANFIFWLAGVGLIAIGVWAWLDRGFFGNLDQFVTSWYLDPILWFALVGVIIFFMATFGCIGALRENICLLKTYSTVLGLMLLLEIGGGVAIYFYRNQIEEFVTNRIDDVAIENYRDNADFQDIIDGFQTGLKCCGVNGYDDWNMNVYFNCTTVVGRYNPEACGVPFSCCVPDPADTTDVINTQCGYGVRTEDQRNSLSERIYEQGCISALKTWLSTNLVVVAVGAGAILLVQIFGFCFATSLASDIRRQMSTWRQRP